MALGTKWPEGGGHVTDLHDRNRDVGGRDRDIRKVASTRTVAAAAAAAEATALRRNDTFSAQSQGYQKLGVQQ